MATSGTCRWGLPRDLVGDFLVVRDRDLEKTSDELPTSDFKGDDIDGKMFGFIHGDLLSDLEERLMD